MPGTSRPFSFAQGFAISSRRHMGAPKMRPAKKRVAGERQPLLLVETNVKQLAKQCDPGQGGCVRLACKLLSLSAFIYSRPFIYPSLLFLRFALSLAHPSPSCCCCCCCFSRGTWKWPSKNYWCPIVPLAFHRCASRCRARVLRAHGSAAARE